MKLLGKSLLRLVAGIFCICSLSVTVLQAQISEGGLPPSFQFGTNLRSGEQAKQIPVNFSVEDLKEVDAWRVSQGAPLCIAKLIKTDLGIDNAGNWVTLPDGQRVWQLHLQAKGAIALLLYYSDFYIPEGGKLYIYNVNKSQVLGAYTTCTHPESGAFATELIAGDEIVLEYVPAPSGEKPQLKISDVGYGYNHLYVRSMPGEDDSLPCMVNINCEEGEEWQFQKKGVCQITQVIGEYAYLCSGSLINNTAKDKKPYILTAFHCSQVMEDFGTASDEALKKWIFYFHGERVGCDNSSPAYPSKTMVGCSRKAEVPVSEGSDGLLLLLSQAIPDNYDVFFNGWDRTNTPAFSGVGIHHPAGDYKKISTYGKFPAGSITWQNADSDEKGAANAFWNVIFDETSNGHSVTEGGSSGSPLFNQDGLIVGTLSGGNSSCDLPDGFNIYGKLNFHWDKYSKGNASRMDAWLDPLHTGSTVLGGMTQAGKVFEAGYKAPAELTALKTGTGDVQLEWTAPVYKKNIGWGAQSITYNFGFGGEPFYYGQRWDTDDLKPVHKKTITEVYFTPEESTTCAIHIQQGDRVYKEDVTNPEVSKINTITLKEPFVVDASQELIVAVHVKSYPEDVLPAFADGGDAVDGKGNLISKDGKEWWTLSPDDYNVNFVLSFGLTSKEGELRSSYLLSSRAKQILQPIESTRLSVKKSLLSTLSSEGMLITAFPELTGYQVYRDNVKLAALPASVTQYIDKKAAAGESVYQVSTLYGDKESAPATAEIAGNVGNESVQIEPEVDIHPRVFSESIQVLNARMIKSLDIFSADGKLIRNVQGGEDRINTSSLPSGVYFFRISADGKVKTVQGIKN